MSIQNYQQLQDNSQTDVALLGCKLPVFTPGQLQVTFEQAEREQLQSILAQFNPSSGWAMLRDQVKITTQLADRADLIEAEWYKPGESLKIKLLGPNRYGVTRFVESNTEDGQAGYTEQTMFMRSGLTSTDEGVANKAHYRLWWRADEAGQWKPLAQQFIGFAGEAK